jgi:hypothetical protein
MRPSWVVFVIFRKGEGNEIRGRLQKYNRVPVHCATRAVGHAARRRNLLGLEPLG